MPLYIALPYQTDEVRILANTPITFQFPVTMYGVTPPAISSARFVIKQAIESTSTIAGITCSILSSTCTAQVGVLTDITGNFVAELSLTMVNGNVYTPLQFPLVLI